MISRVAILLISGILSLVHISMHVARRVAPCLLIYLFQQNLCHMSYSATKFVVVSLNFVSCFII